MILLITWWKKNWSWFYIVIVINEVESFCLISFHAFWKLKNYRLKLFKFMQFDNELITRTKQNWILRKQFWQFEYLYVMNVFIHKHMQAICQLAGSIWRHVHLTENIIFQRALQSIEKRLQVLCPLPLKCMQNPKLWLNS